MKALKLLLLLVFTTSIAFAQKTPTPNYKLAERFSAQNVAKLVFSTSVSPNWLKKGNRFWYQYKTTNGANYYLVDADRKTRVHLFDNVKMAKWLTEITKDPYDAKHLPRFSFKFNDAETAISFYITSTEEVPAVDDKKDAKKDDKKNAKKKGGSKKVKMEKKIYHLEYRLGGNGLTILDNKKEERKWNRWANIAPDSSIVLFSKENNLYWMDKANFLKAVEDEKDSTIVEHQWTKDGVENYSYGGGNYGENNETVEKNKDKRKGVGVVWTPDSKKFVLQRTDQRKIKDLWVINSTSNRRPVLETYRYHMAGEPEFAESELLIFDVPTKKVINIELDTVKQQSLSVYRAPRLKADRSDPFQPSLLLSSKGKVYYNTISRDRKKLDICVADINTGKTTVLIKERFNTYIESQQLVLIKNETEMLHWSERDGWAHFYLYDTAGNLKNQVTNGPFHVAGFDGFDEKSNTLYFTANGVNNGQDPYYAHLYKINLNGSGMKELNPGDFTFSTNMSDSNKYFVNNYSRVNTVPKSELRSSDGKLIMNLEEADLSQLFAAGYKFPEPFKVKADDGITDLYGVMYKPYDFDPNKIYPLLEYVYPGPQTEAVSKAFSLGMTRTDRMAQLGFVLITLGNRGGHPDRSKWYHNYGYGNLRDYGLADKKYVAEQIANKYDYIDINKVGIFGHSGGGFMSTAAMLVYPDFFKVAVSESGNHDNTVYNSWWSETHNGIKEVTDADGKISYEYMIKKNQTIASHLKGKLMLITGDVDNNVHPASTMRVVDALIKAHKRFDLMILPGQRHGYGSMTEYAFWLNADYFTKYLLGVDKAYSTDLLEMNIGMPRTEK